MTEYLLFTLTVVAFTLAAVGVVGVFDLAEDAFEE